MMLEDITFADDLLSHKNRIRWCQSNEEKMSAAFLPVFSPG